MWGKCIPNQVFKSLEKTEVCKILRETSCSVQSRARFRSNSGELFGGRYCICCGAEDAGNLVREKQNEHCVYNSFTKQRRWMLDVERWEHLSSGTGKVEKSGFFSSDLSYTFSFSLLFFYIARVCNPAWHFCIYLCLSKGVVSCNLTSWEKRGSKSPSVFLQALI